MVPRLLVRTGVAHFTGEEGVIAAEAFEKAQSSCFDNPVEWALILKIRMAEVKFDPKRTLPLGHRVCLRETGNRVFTAGECSTLTTTPDNIHEVRGGPKGCRLLDIFTWLGPYPQSVYLEADKQPIEPGTNLYWATFIG